MNTARHQVGTALVLALLLAVGVFAGCGGGAGGGDRGSAAIAKADAVDVTYYFLPG